MGAAQPARLKSGRMFGKCSVVSSCSLHQLKEKSFVSRFRESQASGIPTVMSEMSSNERSIKVHHPGESQKAAQRSHSTPTITSSQHCPECSQCYTCLAAKPTGVGVIPPSLLSSLPPNNEVAGKVPASPTIPPQCQPRLHNAYVGKLAILQRLNANVSTAMHGEVSEPPPPELKCHCQTAMEVGAHAQQLQEGQAMFGECPSGKAPGGIGSPTPGRMSNGPPESLLEPVSSSSHVCLPSSLLSGKKGHKEVCLCPREAGIAGVSSTLSPPQPLHSQGVYHHHRQRQKNSLFPPQENHHCPMPTMSPGKGRHVVQSKGEKVTHATPCHLGIRQGEIGGSFLPLGECMLVTTTCPCLKCFPLELESVWVSQHLRIVMSTQKQGRGIILPTLAQQCFPAPGEGNNNACSALPPVNNQSKWSSPPD